MAEKIGYLDSLRGIAAFMVVLCHFAYGFYPALLGTLNTYYQVGFESLVYASPLSILVNGRFAVFIFFVLSGYILTYKFYSTGDQSILNSSAVRRYFRLLPPILLSLLCTFVILLLFLSFIQDLRDITGIDYIGQYFDQSPDLLEILRQAFWGSFFDARVEYNNVLWTMSIEFIGSMLVFSLASLFGKASHRWVFYLGAGLFLFNTYYLSFILGMLLADMYNGESRKIFAIKNNLILLAVLGAGILFGSFSDLVSYRWIFELVTFIPGISMDMFFHSFGAFLILLALLNSRRLQTLLSNQSLKFLGNISFSMYLMHMIVYGTFTTILLMVLHGSFRLSYGTSLLIAFPLSIMAVLFVSYLAYKYVDLNGIKLSRKIYDMFFATARKPEHNPLDYTAIKRLIISFTEKNLYMLVILQILLIVLAVGSVVFIKPVYDNYYDARAAVKAENGYLQYRNSTIVSYQNLVAYSNGGVDNSSAGNFNDWARGYRYLAEDLSDNYNHMNEYGVSYQSYLNDSEGNAVAANLTYYGRLAQVSQNQSKAYDNAYHFWYWNNTIPIFP